MTFVNQEFGRYTLLEQLGFGAYATVFRARDKTLLREVALKVLHPAFLADTNFVKQFEREAQVVAQLDHPNIISIFDTNTFEGRLFLVMKLAKGPTLESILGSEKRLTWQEVYHVTSKICGALSYAHERNVIHRDLKPANILTDQGMEPLISDFGLATLVGQSVMGTRLTGGVLGTPSYIAPEIWEGKPASVYSDIYALGCLVFELITGKTLFPGVHAMQILSAHSQGAQFPSEWPAGFPAQISNVLHIAVAKVPTNRFASVNDFWNALGKLEKKSSQATTAAAPPKAARTSQPQQLEKKSSQATTAAAPPKAARTSQPQQWRATRINKTSNSREWRIQLGEEECQVSYINTGGMTTIRVNNRVTKAERDYLNFNKIRFKVPDGERIMREATIFDSFALSEERIVQISLAVEGHTLYQEGSSRNSFFL